MKDWVIVATLGTEEEAALVAGFLQAEGIEATVQSLLFHQEPVTFGRLGEVRVLVPPGSRTEAERLLAEKASTQPRLEVVDASDASDTSDTSEPDDSDGERDPSP